jgi:protein gp37
MDHRENGVIQPASDDIVMTARPAAAAFRSVDFKLTQHPLSAAFPPYAESKYAEIRADIAANGLRFPIVLHDEKVLDGWHRYRACLEAGTEPRFEVFEGDMVAAQRFVVSANLHRRHLNESQRGIIAAKLVLAADDQGVKLRVATAAEQLNISAKTVTDATLVVSSGDAARIGQIEAGEVAVSRAAKEVRATKRALIVVPSTPQMELAPVMVEEWKRLTPDVRWAYLTHRNPRAKLNRQNPGEDANLIDWAKWSWNPLTGCLHDCPYCYARDFAERPGGSAAYPNGFAPTFHPERLSAPLNMAPPATDDPRDRRIFAGSMADLWGRWVPDEWIEAVLETMRRAPAWTFLTLTKFPKRMAEFDIPGNVWMGTTVDYQARVAAAEEAFAKVRARMKNAVLWYSCEPMMEELTFRHLDRVNLVVIGGASAASKTPRWIPPFAWVDDLMRQADAAGCAVYLKSNLLRKEEPGGGRYVFTDTPPAVFDYLRGREASA